ncbi:hypothetical protein K4K55_000798 [Colletotrichum sp. SAR 10_96]|nr:hypothetical protein K4K55_000798 [Colletotrichum sp. SAR 10_96]
MDADKSLFGSPEPSKIALPGNPQGDIPRSVPQTVAPQDVLLNASLPSGQASTPSAPSSSPFGRSQTVASSPSPAPSPASTATAIAASGWASPEGQRKCTKCKKDFPSSSFSSRRSMGNVEYFAHCYDCRAKRRKSAAATKARKDAEKKAEQDKQHADQEEQQRQKDHESFQQGAERRDAQREKLASQHRQLQELEQHRLDNIDYHDHSMSRLEPQTYDGLDYDGMNFEDNMEALAKNSPSPYVSPSAFLPSESDFEPKLSPNAVDSGTALQHGTANFGAIDHKIDTPGTIGYNKVNTDSLNPPAAVTDLIVDPLPAAEGATGEIPRGQLLDYDHFEQTTTVVMKTRMSDDIHKMRADYERRRFNDARHKCPFLLTQGDKEIDRLWKRREAAITLDLMVVPIPEPQPIFGQSYKDGSHRSVAGAYDFPMH